MEDAKKYFTATMRNRDAIAQHLKKRLSASSGTLLELGSGSGEHAAYIAPQLVNWRWQTSDIDSENLASIKAWKKESNCDRLINPLKLDLMDTRWDRKVVSDHSIDVIFSANVIHIAPSDVWYNILKGSAALLPKEGLLIFYGPFCFNNKEMVASNQDFDQWLKAENPDYGIRNWDMIADIAGGLDLQASPPVNMPANNYIIELRKIS